MISVLYVDDDSGLLDLTKLYLEETGEIHVDTATSARQALDMFRHQEYDAVISDCQMPVMDGIEFLRLIRSRYPLLPVIMFSGKDRDELAMAAFESGADSYLRKGGNPKVMFAELSHTIIKAVERYLAQKALAEIAIRLFREIQNASDFVVFYNNQGRVIYNSPSTTDILGYPDRFFVGQHFGDLIHPDDRASALSAFDQVCSGKKTGLPFGFRVRKSNGNYLDIDTSFMNLIGIPGLDGIVLTAWPSLKKDRLTQIDPEERCARSYAARE
ncbi:response regulator [Methanoregula formicica]|uniref:PAS domain S-box n=1 Tax=Methanoregula formicica (strain DSM 22288 / NBRC 105244 / SMSP) TaxID=593750 RepID=L0HG57_METFS|nr:response regulator [Methanoregula formicica]AGB03702.1 PAS domain S-box [Methanoregula formicica SMSP]